MPEDKAIELAQQVDALREDNRKLREALEREKRCLLAIASNSTLPHSLIAHDCLLAVERISKALEAHHG